MISQYIQHVAEYFFKHVEHIILHPHVKFHAKIRSLAYLIRLWTKM